MPAASPTPPSLLTLILLTGLAVLSLNMFLPSLKQIADGFGVDYGVASLSIGGYLAVSAVLQVIMGPLSDLIGRRKVLLGGLALFTLASIGCVFAPDFRVFLAFRVLQSGVVSGMVLSRAIIRDMHAPREAARLLGVVGMAMALAPLLGPIAGGLLDQAFGWRASFVAFVIMGAVMLVIVWRDLGETNLTPSATFTAQFRSYPDLLRHKLFWAYTICIVFSVGGFYAFLGGAPHVGESVYGLTPALLGVGMGSISGGFMLGNFLVGRYTVRLGPVRLILIGRVIGTIGPILAMVVVWAGMNNPAVMFAGAILVGLGNGLTLPGVNAGVMSVAPHLAGSASGLSGALTVAGGAVLTSLAGALVADVTGRAGVYLLLAMMTVTSLMGLLAALAIRRLEAV